MQEDRSTPDRGLFARHLVQTKQPAADEEGEEGTWRSWDCDEDSQPSRVRRFLARCQRLIESTRSMN